MSAASDARRTGPVTMRRQRGERERARRDRRRRRRPARGACGGGGHEGGRGKPARGHHRHHRAWFEGRQAGDGRPVHGTCGRRGRTAAEGALPAVHGAFRTRHTRQAQSREPGLGGRRVEGRVLHGNECVSSWGLRFRGGDIFLDSPTGKRTLLW